MIQSYTPYRSQQRPIVTSVNMAEYIHVGVDVQWTPFFSKCCEFLLVLALSLLVMHAFVAPGIHTAHKIRNVRFFFPRKQTRLEELHRLWELLLQKTKEKGLRLLQAQKLVQYLRECEDALDWISDKVRVKVTHYRPLNIFPVFCWCLRS